MTRHLQASKRCVTGHLKLCPFTLQNLWVTSLLSACLLISAVSLNSTSCILLTPPSSGNRRTTLRFGKLRLKMRMVTMLGYGPSAPLLFSHLLTLLFHRWLLPFPPHWMLLRLPPPLSLMCLPTRRSCLACLRWLTLRFPSLRILLLSRRLLSRCCRPTLAACPVCHLGPGVLRSISIVIGCTALLDALPLKE